MKPNQKALELETLKLWLKPISLEHIPDYKKHFIDYEVIRTLSAQVPWPYPEKGVEEFLKNVIFPKQGKSRWTWGLFLKTNPKEIIGNIDLWREGCPEHRGFWLGRKFWGQGLMTEAVKAVNAYAFEELGFKKLVFANAVGNHGSHRVKEKTGAKLVEVRPGKFVDPELTQQELWELTYKDWFASQL